MSPATSAKQARPRDAALTLMAYANARSDVIAGMVDPSGVLTHVVVEEQGGTLAFLDRQRFLRPCARPERVCGTELAVGEAQAVLRMGGHE